MPRCYTDSNHLYDSAERQVDDCEHDELRAERAATRKCEWWTWASYMADAAWFRRQVTYLWRIASPGVERRAVVRSADMKRARNTLELARALPSPLDELARRENALK